MIVGILAPVQIREFSQYINKKNVKDLPEGSDCPVMTEIIKFLLKEGHDVVIFTLANCRKVFRGPNLTICIGQYVKIGKVRAITQFYAERKQLERYMKSFPCDVYHANWSYEYAMAALNLQPNRTIVTLHDWAPRVYELMHDFYRERRLFMSKRVLKEARNVTCVSDYIKEMYLADNHANSVLTIGNCVNTDEAYTEEKNLRVLNPVIVVSAHGFNQLKNTRAAIEAFAIIRKQIPDAVMRLYGCDHEEGGPAEQFAREKGIEAGIFFIGPVIHADMIKAFREADLLIHPSNEESFGLVVVEAMINKTPIIGGKNTGGVREIVERTGAGILVDVNDPEEIAKETIRILRSPEIWKKQESMGYEGAMCKFRVETIARQYLDVYRNVSEIEK